MGNQVSLRSEDLVSEIKTQNKQARVIFILPFSMPNSGKTSVWRRMKSIMTSQDENTLKILKGRKLSFDLLSGDDIRKQVKDDFERTHGPVEDVYQQTQQLHQEQCKKKLIELISQTKFLARNDLHIIYIDRNHPPAEEGIIKIVNDIDQNMPVNIEYQIVYLIPNITNKLIPDYPFSYTFLAQVFTNAVNRKVHQTLDNSDIPKAFGVIFDFMRLSKSSVFDQQFLDTNQLDSFFTLPLTNEQKVYKDDSNFKRLVDQALENIEQDNNCYLGSGNQNFKNLQDQIIKNQGEHTSDEIMDYCIFEQLEQIISNERWRKKAGSIK